MNEKLIRLLRFKHLCYFIIVPIILMSCEVNWIFKDNLGNGFSIYYPFEPKSRSLYYEKLLILKDESVFSVGYNGQFIIVKTHPYDTWINDINTGITKYFIIDKNSYIKATAEECERYIYGGYNETQFEEKRQELKLSDKLDFTKDYDNQY